MGIAPVKLFRNLHHPQREFCGTSEIALEFRQGRPIDYLLISQEEVGGVWNGAPRDLISISPGHWMELAFYPLADHVQDLRVDVDDVDEPISRRNLVNYYRCIPGKFGQSDHIRTRERVEQIEPHQRGFLLRSRDLCTGNSRQYTCKYVIYAVGQRCILRRLNVRGENLSFVTNRYSSPEDFSGFRFAVVGGGRSGDWVATELHDAGRQVFYIMRQPFARHHRSEDDRHYGRITEIKRSRSPRFEILYETQVKGFERFSNAGRVILSSRGKERTLNVDHVVVEIGGIADYSIFKGFPPLNLSEMYDRHRLQVHQLSTYPHNYESTEIPNLYPGGYLAKGILPFVGAMHGSTYPIVGDIAKKEGAL